MNLDVTNFAAERLVMGQKVEAAALRVRADNQGYCIRGDVKINGIPALLEYRKPRDQSEAEVRVAATLDEAARARLGFDLGGYVSGPVPVQDQRPRAASKPATAAIRSRPTLHRRGSTSCCRAGSSRPDGRRACPSS